MDVSLPGIPIGEKFIMRGGLNGHIGRNNNNCERVNRSFVYGVRNKINEKDFIFSCLIWLVIASTCFKKRDQYLITYKTELNFHSNILFTYKEGRRSLM